MFVLTHALLLVMLAAMAGFCLTGDIFNLFVFYELIAVTAFGLAAYRTPDRSSLRAALNFAITNSIGAFVFLIGIALLYGRTGALNLAQIGENLGRAHRVDGLVVIVVRGDSLIGLLIKAAVVPFHFWLVDVATCGPLPLVMVLGGVLDALAAFGFARIYWAALAPAVGPHEHALRVLLVTLGVTTAVVGALLASLVRGPWRVLVFVMVSHTGTLLVGIGCLTALGLSGAAVYAVAGGAIKAGLFLGTDLLDRDTGSHTTDGAAVRAPRRRWARARRVARVRHRPRRIGHRAFGRARPGCVDRAAPARRGGADPVWPSCASHSAPCTSDARMCPRPDQSSSRPCWSVSRSPRASCSPAGWPPPRRRSSRLPCTGVSCSTVQRSARRPPCRGVGMPASTVLLDLGAVLVALAAVAWLDWIRFKARHHTGDLGGTTAGNAVRRLHAGNLGDSVAWATVGATVIAVALATTLH